MYFISNKFIFQKNVVILSNKIPFVMIQVINRALDILEFIGQDPEKPKPLGDIVKELGLNPATCANIIKTLTNRKYLDKIDRLKGYCLGSKAYALTSNTNYKKDLVDAARPELEALTKKINENSLLAVLNEDLRVAIIRASSIQDIQANTASEKKAYDSASGRLLVAMLPDEELEKFILKYDLPAPDTWKGVSSKKSFVSEVKRIRREKFAMQITNKQIVGLAVPVSKSGKVIASLSVYLPSQRFNKEKKEELLTVMNKMAGRIEKKITGI